MTNIYIVIYFETKYLHKIIINLNKRIKNIKYFLKKKDSKLGVLNFYLKDFFFHVISSFFPFNIFL
jgi:hypothetical protein